MSVAPVQDPAAEGGGAKYVAQGSRNADEGEDAAVCVGSVLVMLTESAEEEVAMYQPTGGGAASDPGKICSAAQREHCFVAVLAPSSEAALAMLENQPPGTYLLAKEKDLAIAVYVKFRCAVRVATLVKGKEMKKLEHPFDWSKSRQPAPGVEAIPILTPVHRMYLSMEAYLHLERCWKRFLPQIQAIVFELCCELQVDEDMKLEDWSPAVLSSASTTSCSVILMPSACGFYILATPNSRDSDSASLVVVPVRQVEFDFQKLVLTVADGTLKPAAFMLSTHFSTKRMFEADFTFAAIRDNFLSPGQVTLKETSVTPTSAQQSSFPNCIELGSSDPELALLAAAQAVCGAVVPHEPLPETFVSVMCELHRHFAKTSLSAGDNGEPLIAPQKLTSWPAQKIKMAAHVIPVLLELLMASATFSEANDPDIGGEARSTAAAKKKTQLLAQFSRVMRFDLLFMAMRSDDSAICRLTHQVFQLIGTQGHLPGEFIELVRDLAALFPLFLRLFLRNHGTTMLWKALHSSVQVAPAAIDPHKSRRSLPNIAASPSVGRLLQGGGERKGSLLGFTLKTSAKSRKSLSLGVTQAKSALTSSKPLALFRLSPLSVQLELGMQLQEGQFVLPNLWRDDVACANHTFCCCTRQESSSESEVHGPPLCGVQRRHQRAETVSCARNVSKQTSKMSMYELVLQLALHFLYNKASCPTWDRDVALLLRLDDMHESFFSKILHVVERRTKTDDSLLKAAFGCRIRVVIGCISGFFRLEIQRRRDMTTVLGEKRYSSLFRVSRAKIREFNEALSDECGDAADQEAATENEDEVGTPGMLPFAALADIFQWIPRTLLNEWMVSSLEDLLQTLQELCGAVKTVQVTSKPRQERYVGYVLQILQVFRVILERTSDSDIQTLLVRVLGCGSAVVPLLRFVLLVQATSQDISDTNRYKLQKGVLTFLHAFAKLDLALPARNSWSLSSRSVRDDSSEEDEDDARLEQKKGELLMTLLAPNLSADDDEQTLWDFVLELLAPTEQHLDDNSVATFGASACMLGVAADFRSTGFVPELLTPDRRGYFEVLEAFLLLQQKLYMAQDPENKSSLVDYEHCIAGHLYCIEQYRDRITANTGKEVKKWVFRVMGLHLRCLIVLANRRSLFSAVQEVFNNLDVLLWVLRRLLCHTQVHGNVDAPLAIAASDVKAVGDTEDGTNVCLPPLKLPGLRHPDACDPPQRNPEELLCSQLNLSQLPSGVPQSAATKRTELTKATLDQAILVAEPVLHTLLVVLMASFIVVDPNLALDDAVCPRVSVPGQEPSGKGELSDLLWTLQQHLATVELDQRCFECVMLELSTLQTFGGACRASAIRLLLRLLCPNRFDRDLYANPRQDKPVGHNQDSSNSEGASNQEQSTREYIAKGGFATVYRSQPALIGSAPVAVKLLGHQKRAGEVCTVSGLYNEVRVLKKLRGELAATQLLDYGNHHAEKSFEIVMEYCPCSLTEWRATFTRAEMPGIAKVSFRSCLLLLLRVFDEIGRCLDRIHKSDVCHFDIKGDNILARTSSRELTRRLLHQENDKPSKASIPDRGPSGCICFADFGESMIVDAENPPPRRSTFSSFSSASSPHAKPTTPHKPREKCLSLSRTRGTEAVKSPEVLRIKGSEDAKVKVTLASDVWSMGCLVYELVTQELLFEKDDWAGLYAHVVIAEHDSVLRADHEEKMLAALGPTSDQETGIVLHLIALCNKILCRTPSARPTLKMISTKVHALVKEVLQLPVTPEDEAFASELSSPEPVSDASRSIAVATSWSPARQPFCRAPYTNALTSEQQLSSVDAPAITVPIRLFGNIFVLADVARTHGSQMVISSVGSGAGPGSSDALAMSAFEAQHEAHFAHFVYLAWLDNTSINVRSDGLPARASEAFLCELHQEPQRTCILLDPMLKTHAGGCVALPPGTRLFQQLVQRTPHFFPVLQRRLREEAGNVAFLVLGGDTTDTSTLHDALVGMLLFFLQRSLAMSTLEALSWFSRDCAQFLDYPRVEFLQHLTAFASTQPSNKPTAVLGAELGSRWMVQCTCGTSVLSVETAAVEEAQGRQPCTCQPSGKDEGQEAEMTEGEAVPSCPCFHPFPVTVDSSGAQGEDEDDDVGVVGIAVVLDIEEERLLLPFESRSKRGEEVAWVSVPAASVRREDGVSCRWAPLLCLPTTSPTSICSARGQGVSRTPSRLEKLKRRASRAAGDISSRSHRQHSCKEDKEACAPSSGVSLAASRERLLQGLRPRGRHASWRLYECASCRLPVCAVQDAENGDRVELPVMSARQATPCG